MIICKNVMMLTQWQQAIGNRTHNHTAFLYCNPASLLKKKWIVIFLFPIHQYHPSPELSLGVSFLIWPSSCEPPNTPELTRQDFKAFYSPNFMTFLLWTVTANSGKLIQKMHKYNCLNSLPVVLPHSYQVSFSCFSLLIPSQSFYFLFVNLKFCLRMENSHQCL